jgi:Uncharacterized protein conserved in bacteria (DUF2252)
MAASTKVPHLSVDERLAKGKQARDRTPPASHGGWVAGADRPDPVGLLQGRNLTREPDLVPVRHGRMLVSPFTFYRGAAMIMAADLDGTPTAELQAVVCGDAHLSNFGAFARAAISMIRCSCRSRRRPGRSWRDICPRAATSAR